MSFYLPGERLSKEIVDMFMRAFHDEQIKAELHKAIRVEIDNQRTKLSSGGSVQSYDSLTSGNVNMQAKMAASGYDVYGRTIIGGNYNASNQNIYKKMKNKIKYGRSPQKGYIDHGQRSIV